MGVGWNRVRLGRDCVTAKPGKSMKPGESLVPALPEESPLSFLDFPPEADVFGPGSAGIIMKKVSEKT